MSDDSDDTTSSNKPFTVKYRISKEGNNYVYRITWIFPKFRQLLNDTAAREFRTITVANEPASKFQLRMLLWGQNNDLVEMYYLSPTTLYLEFEIQRILKYPNKDGRSLLYKHDLSTIQANKWQNVLKIFKTSLSDLDYRYALKFTVPVPDESLEINRMGGMKVPEANQLCKELGILLADKTFADVTIKSADGEEFRSHKSVLAARSKVLKAHFEHNTKEALSNVIESPLESEVLREILTYIYSSRVPRIDDIPEKLLAAADYYELGGLKSICEEALQKKLTVVNAIDTLQLADLYSSHSLKQSTFEFIQNGRASLITETEAWKNLQSVELVKAIFLMCNASSRLVK